MYMKLDNLSPALAPVSKCEAVHRLCDANECSRDTQRRKPRSCINTMAALHGIRGQIEVNVRPLAHIRTGLQLRKIEGGMLGL